jgi:hypothetical protein
MDATAKATAPARGRGASRISNAPPAALAATAATPVTWMPTVAIQDGTSTL